MALKIKLSTAFLAAIIFIGIWARFWELSWHFSHIDDIGVVKAIFDYQKAHKPPFLAVSTDFNYSPFQYLITPLLISPNQSYRDLLFWGRLPSCVFSVLGLLALVLFYKKFKGEIFPCILLPLALISFSWEGITFAKQMHNYAAGLTAAILLLVLFADNLSQKNYGWLRVMLNSVCLAVFCYMQYLILFFIPPFFLVLFVHAWKYAQKKLVLIVKFILGGIVYASGIFPLWFYFLKKQVESGNQGLSEWNKGPHYEFLFQLKHSMSLLEKIHYALGFYLKNFLLIFQVDTAIIPEGHALFRFLSYSFFVLFIFGCASFFGAKDEKKKFIGLYFGVFFVLWFVLVALQKITFSPTRHNYILALPIAVAIGEGVSFLFERLQAVFFRLPQLPLSYWAHLTLAAFACILFLRNYPVYLNERRDKLIEPEIIQTLQKYNVDTVLATRFTYQIEVMKGIRQLYNFYESGYRGDAVISNGPPKYQRMAWISHREDLTSESYLRAQDFINFYIKVTNSRRQEKGVPLYSPLFYPLVAYRILYSKVIDSDVEVEFSGKTQNGQNGLYFYILELQNE